MNLNAVHERVRELTTPETREDELLGRIRMDTSATHQRRPTARMYYMYNAVTVNV